MGKPNPPKSMTGPKRENTTKFVTEWKSANNYKDEKNGWKHLTAYVYYNDDTQGYDHSFAGQGSKGEGPAYYRRVGVSTTRFTHKINRKKWAPFNKGKELRCISVIVESDNEDGVGVSKLVRMNFDLPKNPKCTFEYDDTTGLLRMICEAPTHDKKDRYDCVYKVYRQDTKTNSSRYKDGKKRYALNANAKEIKGTTTKTEFVLTSNVEQMALLPGSSIKFIVELTSRGFRGNTTKTFSYIIKPPVAVAIKKIDISNDDKLNLTKNALLYKNTTGMVRVFYYSVDSADYYQKAATDYTLQRLVTSYDVNRAVEVAVRDGWTDVDTNLGSTSDSKKVSKVADAVMGEPTLEVLTAMGFNNNAHVFDVRVWYRIKSVRQGMVRYSTPAQCKELASPVPSAKNDYSGFMCLRNSVTEPGTAIEGLVGWQLYADGDSRSNEGVTNPNWKDATWTTIVEWSEHRHAIASNNKPNTLEITWKYSASKHNTAYANYVERVKKGEFGDPSDLKTWHKSAFFALYGLSPGVKYYLWTRRHMVLGEYDEYGPRTAAPSGYFPFTPIDNPTSVQVYTEENYIYGRDMLVSWAHNAVCDQKSWNIYVIPYNTKYLENTTLVKSIPKKLIASGTGKMNSYKINGGILNEIQPKCAYGNKKYFTITKKMGIVVGVSTGGKEILSCSDDKGRFIGANYLDIGHIPTGKLKYIGSKTTTNYSLSINGGYSGTTIVLNFKATTTPNTNAITFKLVDVRCSNMRYKSHLNYTITIKNSNNQVRYKYNGVVRSKTKEASGTLLSTTVKLNKSITVESYNAKIYLSFTGYKTQQGGYYIDYNGTKRSIPASNSTPIVGKKIKVPRTTTKTYKELPTAYLFSRTSTVTGEISVFAVSDTAYRLPDGEHLQPAGECVFTKNIASSKFGKTDDVLNAAEKKAFKSIITGSKKYPYVAKVNVYSHRNMFDKSQYVIQAYLRDTYDTSLVSASMTKTFTHNPQHEARVCGKGSRVEGSKKPYQMNKNLAKSTVSKGSSILDAKQPPSPSVVIKIERPTNYNSSDRYDIYRMTPDGGVRIAKDRKFDGKTFKDRYAPYSNDKILRYAIVTITAGGDMAWRELRYSLKHTPGMRFDWGSIDNERSLELPYDVELNDSYTKDVRVDTYLDGSVSAHFNKAIVRKASNKAKLVKCDFTKTYSDPLKFAMVRELARYAGPVFFRADNGVAYECVVEVDGIDENYDSLVSPVSFKLTEINPPSSRYSSTVRKRDSKKFTPSSVGQSGTTVAQDTISTHLLMDYVAKDKAGKSIVKSKSFSLASKKTYDDVKIYYSTTISDKTYKFNFPVMCVDLRHAINKEMATGVIGKTKNNYSVYMRLLVKEGNTTLHDKTYLYGKMDGATYKMLTPPLTMADPTFSVKRGKANRNIAIKMIVSMMKDVSDDVNYKLTYGKYVLYYTQDSNPGGNKPYSVRIGFDKIVCGVMSSSVSRNFRITVSAVPYGHSKYSSSQIYYTSDTIAITNKIDKKTTHSLGKGFYLARDHMKKNKTVYVNLISQNEAVSKKMVVKGFHDMTKLHTNITNPETKNVTIKKK